MTALAKRVVISKLQKTVATLNVEGFDITFNYENEASKPISSVQVSGSNGNGFVSYSLNKGQTSIGFSNTPFNQNLLTAIQNEIDDIISEETENLPTSDQATSETV